MEQTLETVTADKKGQKTLFLPFDKPSKTVKDLLKILNQMPNDALVYDAHGFLIDRVVMDEKNNTVHVI